MERWLKGRQQNLGQDLRFYMFSFELTPVSFLTQKMLLKNAGVKGRKTVFLLTDTQIKDEAFLEDVDSILNTGEVPNLFAMDEKQEIMEVKPSILQDEQSGTLIYFMSLFLRRYVPLPKVETRIWSWVLWLSLHSLWHAAERTFTLWWPSVLLEMPFETACASFHLLLTAVPSTGFR